jgi:hypothetical protein
MLLLLPEDAHINVGPPTHDDRMKSDPLIAHEMDALVSFKLAEQLMPTQFSTV